MAAGRGHGPPNFCVWASLGSFCVSPDGLQGGSGGGGSRGNPPPLIGVSADGLPELTFFLGRGWVWVCVWSGGGGGTDV